MPKGVASFLLVRVYLQYSRNKKTPLFIGIRRETSLIRINSGVFIWALLLVVIQHRL